VATWTDVGAIDAFPSGTMVAIAGSRHDVVILRVESRVYAFRNSCPHAAAKICAGRVIPRTSADRPGPGEGEIDVGNPVITCPWHGWEFEPRTGAAIADPRMRLKTWPARLDGERVLVEL
jgi:nitrite reductase/ring-hydroxylating ferredoxin subunit